MSSEEKKVKKIPIKLIVNGEEHELEAKPYQTLVDVLRNNLGLIGTKYGCETGECGACTILIDGRPVVSCLTLAVEAEGKNITTIEGLVKEGRLHPLQEAFVKYHAMACGYCTPAMILSAKALLDSNPNPTEEDVKRSISGVLCRCTGYVKIIKAIMAAAEVLRGGER